MRLSKSHPRINTLRCALTSAARKAAKYAAPSMRKASRCARSMRQQLRPGASSPVPGAFFSCMDRKFVPEGAPAARALSPCSDIVTPGLVAAARCRRTPTASFCRRARFEGQRCVDETPHRGRDKTPARVDKRERSTRPAPVGQDSDDLAGVIAGEVIRHRADAVALQHERAQGFQIVRGDTPTQRDFGFLPPACEPQRLARQAGKEEPIVPRKLVRRLRFAAARNISAARPKPPLIRDERPRDERRILEFAGADREVNAFSDEVHPPVRDQQFDAYLGMGAKIFPYDTWQYMVPDVHRRRYPQQPGGFAGR